MSWSLEQCSGRIFDGSMNLCGFGYSGGECGLCPEAVNNPSMEGLVNKGPLPSGDYEADRLDLYHPKLGEYVIHLSPDPETRARIIAYGRNPDTFYWHGDDKAKAGQQAASDGCLVSVRLIRQAFWEGVDHWLRVVATFG
jgi:hypothetical protein